MAGQDRQPTKEEFAREVEVAVRNTGYQGAITRDAAQVSVENGEFLNLESLYAQLASWPAERRQSALAKAVHFLVNPPRLPETWEEAAKLVLPVLKRRIDIVVEDAYRALGQGPPRVYVAELTPHLVFELKVPVVGATLSVPMECLGRWGIGPETAFRAAGANLRARTPHDWLGSPKYPGAFISPWRDGFDCSRLFMPDVFGRLVLKGRPVALPFRPSLLAVAGSEDEEGLFQMGQLARRTQTEDKGFYTQRTLRMGADGESWEDWLPAKGHAAYESLRLLRAMEESRDYAEQAAVTALLAKAKNTEAAPLPRLEVVQTAIGAEVLAFTTWRAGKPVALPKADAIVLRRGDEVLGIASWDKVREALPGQLRPLPGYPPRFLATDFPDDWQLGGLDLAPWQEPRSG
jgi:hypothetical protein